MQGGSRRLIRALALAALAPAVAAPAATANRLTEIQIPDRGGEIPSRWLPGYPGPPRARVLLPDGYDPARAYPVLFLIAGAANTYRFWSDPGQGEVAKVAAGLDAIVVMPEGGTGWYTDWWNGGRRGGPAWESYVLDQVVPQVMVRYRIRPERRYHALAGVSMGGLGTAYLGGRVPGFFGSIAIISGLVHTHLVPGENVAQSFIPQALAGAPLDAEALYGPERGFYSHGHDPVRLAANLRETRVFMSTGDGTVEPDPGALDLGNATVSALAEGLIIRGASDNFAAALRAAGGDLEYHVHPGTHSWPNFRRELRAAIRWDLFAPVDEQATSWVNDTVATHGKLWEFAYRFDSPPDRIVRFRRSGARLAVGAAGAPVRITTDGGCVLHVPTPATIEVPAQPCAKLAASVTPRRVRPGRRTRVRVQVRPALAGALVRIGAARARTDANGVARLRVCVRRGGRVRVRASIANRLPATAWVRTRGAGRGRCGAR